MFVRVKTTPNSPRKSIQICEGVRVNGKVKQKILRHIGIASDEREENKLKDLANETMLIMLAERNNTSQQQSLFLNEENDFKSLPKNNKAGRPKAKNLKDILPPEDVRLNDIIEESRIVEGIHDVAGVIFDELYGSLFFGKKPWEILKDIVLLRLESPASKHRTQKNLKKRFGKSHDLDAIYRMMDRLFENIDNIKKLTFLKTKSLFPEKIDLLLFDVTTLYFESTNIDDLRNFGYSKDHRFNTTQVVLALATNQDGLPIGYELFEGNRAEVTTLCAAIDSWKRLFHIGDVCFVGDRAMFTKNNIVLLEQNHYHYIIAAKLKGLPKAMQSHILDENNYHPGILNNTLAWISEFNYGNSRLIVSYKTQRAIKDKKDREQILNKIEKIIGKKGNPHNLITNAGVKKFVTKDDKAAIALDEDKINQAAHWDGLHGVITNIKEDSPASIIARYARLWVIEESFRINKHTLQMRPIFHWKPERIHSHIAICYMTFSVLRHIQYRANLMQKISIDQILDELREVQATIFVHKKTKDKYRVPGHFSNEARRIYKAFNLERSLDAMIYQP
jgi:transposase